MITADGHVVSTASGDVTGIVSTPFAERTASVLGHDAMIAVSGHLAHIGTSGERNNVLDIDDSALRSLRAGADGSRFVVGMKNSVTVVEADGGHASMTAIGGLRADEGLVDADIAPDGHSVAFATDAGRVGVQSLGADGSASFWSEQLPGGMRTQLSYVPATGDIAVVSSDGTVRLFGADLKVKATSFFGAAADHLITSGRWALMSSAQAGTSLYDAQLVMRDHQSNDQVDLSATTVRLDAAGKQLTALAITDPQAGKGSVRFHVPLPTI